MDTETLLGYAVINYSPNDWGIRFNGQMIDPNGDEHSPEDILESIAEVRKSIAALDELERLIKWAQTMPSAE